MKKLCLVFIYFFIIISGLIPVSSNPITIKGGKQEFDLEFKISFTNPQVNPQGIKVVLPVARDDEPRQSVEQLEIFPKPYRIINREDGNLAEIIFENIGQGETVTFGFKAQLINHRIFHNIDAENVTGDIAIAARRYLASNKRFPAKDPVVTKLAEEILQGESNRYYQALNFYDYVRSLKFEMSGKPAPVLDVIKSGVCQCSDAADLFITLCRSTGIPARYCGGIFLKETMDSTPDTHAWAEIYLHPYGWIPVDPTMGRFDTKTRLSRFAEIDSPYLLLWKDTVNPFSVINIDSADSFNIEDFTFTAIYKANLKRSGIPVKEAAPDFIAAFPSASPLHLLSSHQQAKENYLSAVKALQENKNQEGETLIRKALSEDPSFLLAYRSLVSIYERKNDLNSLYKELLEIKDQKNTRGAVYYALGVMDTIRGGYSQGALHLNKAREMGALSFIIDYNLGILYIKAKQIPFGVKYYVRALSANPQAQQVYEGLMEVLNYLEDYEAVVQLCQSAFSAVGNVLFMNEIAKASIELGNFNNAERAAKKAVEMSPNAPSYHGVLAWVYIETGRVEEARSTLQKAVELGLSKNQAEFLENKLKDLKR